MVETKGKIDVRAAQARQAAQMSTPAQPPAAYKTPSGDTVKPAEATTGFAKAAPVKDTKAEHAAIEKVATINQRLAKEGSGNRVDVQMRGGEPHYQWGNFVPTRELTEDELDAVETLK